MSEQSSSAASQPVGQSAGEMLRNAREHKGLDVEQAASRLNLRPSLVTDLESEQYSQLRIPAYRRGYLRAYARLLDIDPEAVLKAHDAMHGNPDKPIKVNTVLQPDKASNRMGKVSFHLVSVIIILIIIGLTTLWWKGHSGADFSSENTASGPSQPNNTRGTNSESNTQTAQSQATQTNQQQSPAPSGQTNSNTPSTPASNTAANSGNASDNTSNDNIAHDVANQGTDVSHDLQMQVSNGVDGSKLTASEARALGNQGTNSTASGNSDANAAQAATSTNSITLNFREESWTRVMDASRKVILAGLQPAGSQQTVTGQPPFRLTVGNVSGVTVSYTGQKVDIPANAIRSNVARFTLGDNN